MRGRSRRLAVGTLLVGLMLSLAPAVRADERGESDPLEGLNRKIFWFNDKVDVYVLEPVARGWKRITPRPVRTSIRNFFDNVRTPLIAVNNLLQAKPIESASDLGRFGVNTTVGVLGLFDPASRWGLEKHNEDFGQTLGRWHMPPGPYLVLPFFGPSNIRDTGGLAVDSCMYVYPFFTDGWWLLLPAGARGLDIINYRAAYLAEVEEAKRSSFDYYVFVRNAYVQRRDALVHDREEGTADQQMDLYHPDGGGTP